MMMNVIFGILVTIVVAALVWVMWIDNKGGGDK